MSATHSAKPNGEGCPARKEHASSCFLSPCSEALAPPLPVHAEAAEPRRAAAVSCSRGLTWRCMFMVLHRVRAAAEGTTNSGGSIWVRQSHYCMCRFMCQNSRIYCEFFFLYFYFCLVILLLIIITCFFVLMTRLCI